ncbi:MAG: hydantoinase/oxoprolinase family protein, partial [Ramlibacter sp.]|nr:hydantoinase/oxoprolinase family protein [Ramlibacter sp.]
VTDADLLLGYVDERSFLGGDFALDRPAARKAMDRLADGLGISLERCAFGIHDMVNESMAEAAAMQATDSGVDPRTLPMIAFGGAGPVHAYGVARKLGLRKVICPLGAGVTSAVGLLGAPVAADLSASLPMSIPSWDANKVREVLDKLAAQGREVVLASGVAVEDVRYSYTADMRHVGQGHEISVNLPDGEPGAKAFLDELLVRFHDAYIKLYGRNVSGTEAEVITWRIRARGPKGDVTPSRMRASSASSGKALKGRRPVYFQESGGYVDTPVYDHYAMQPGQEVAGPAIVEQRESTVVVGPRGRFALDEQFNLIMHLD